MLELIKLMVIGLMVIKSAKWLVFRQFNDQSKGEVYGVLYFGVGFQEIFLKEAEK